jgi:hypothetical protein
MYEVMCKIFQAGAVKIIKLTIRPISCNHPRSSCLPHIDTGPTVSSIFGMLPGSCFLSVCQALCDSTWIYSMLPNRSAVRILGTNLAVTWCMPNSFIRTHWHVPRWHKIWCTLAVPFSDSSWKSPQVMYTTLNKCMWKLPTSTHLHVVWHTDSLGMVVLPSTGALCYHNCCGTSPECFGYYLIQEKSYLKTQGFCNSSHEHVFKEWWF